MRTQQPGITLLALIILLVLSTDCQAKHELEYKSKKANKEDVLGAWEMTYQLVRPGLDTDSLFFADNQILKFAADGYVKNITSTKTITKEVAKVYLETMPKRTTFLFAGDGLLIIERSKEDLDNIVISIITKDMKKPLRDGAPVLKKGELLLSYIDSNKKLYMQRFFRRIELE